MTGSNCRHLACKASALPAELIARVVVTPTGFEPMLSPWKGGVLTAWPRGHGSSSRTRTYDKSVNSRLLYRLSYWGTTCSIRNNKNYNKEPYKKQHQNWMLTGKTQKKTESLERGLGLPDFTSPVSRQFIGYICRLTSYRACRRAYRRALREPHLPVRVYPQQAFPS